MAEPYYDPMALIKYGKKTPPTSRIPRVGLGAAAETGPQTLLDGTDSATGLQGEPAFSNTTNVTANNQYQNPYVDKEGNMTGYGQTQVGLGLGQLGLGVAGYLENRKTGKKNRELMGQQIASNKAEMANTAAFRKGLGAQFGSGV